MIPVYGHEPDIARTQSFTYANLNRVKTAQSQATSGTHCWGLQFGYDIWANLKTATVTKCSAPALGLTINNLNRIADTGFGYDAAGNMTAEPGKTYTYDAENRMTAAGSLAFVYDGDGRRVKKGTNELYWYGTSADALVESAASGAVTDEFVFFGGRRIARVTPTAVFYYFADHLGTSRVIVQAEQTTPCYEADYYPFGGERVITNTCPQAYKFTGKERDPETNLDYFGARYYSSQYGRFASADLPFIDQKTTNPQSWNLYSYVRNDPLKFVDPTGHYLRPYGAAPSDVLPSVSGSPMDNWGLGSQGIWTREVQSFYPIPQAAIARPWSRSSVFLDDPVSGSVFNLQFQSQTPSAPPNSRTDVVLIPVGDGKPRKVGVEFGLWQMSWIAWEADGETLIAPGSRFAKSKVTLVRRVNDGPWKHGGAEEGRFDMVFSQYPSSTANLRFSLDGKRIQVVLGKDDQGKLIKALGDKSNDPVPTSASLLGCEAEVTG